MALLWADGFDHYGTAANALLAGYSAFTPAPYATNPRTGPYSVRFTSSNFQYIRRILDASVNCLIIGMAVRVNVAYAFTGVLPCLARIQTDGAGTTSFRVGFGTLNDIVIYSGSGGGVLLGQSPPNTVRVGSWDYYEIKAFRGNGTTTSRIEVRQNGVPIIVVVGATLGATDWAAFTINSDQSAGGSAPDYQIDDLYVCDNSGTFNNDFLGDQRAYTSLVNADTALAAWLKSSGTVGYSLLNIVPPVDTNYVEADNVGDISEFQKAAVGVNTTAVNGVVLFARGLKTDAGTASYRVGIDSAGFVANGPSVIPGTSSAYQRYIVERDPNGTIPWTKASVDLATLRLTRDS